MQQIAGGKIWGYSQAVALVVGPALALAATLLFAAGSPARGLDLVLRLGLFGLGYSRLVAAARRRGGGVWAGRTVAARAGGGA